MSVCVNECVYQNVRKCVCVCVCVVCLQEHVNG